MDRVLHFNDYELFAYVATGFAAMLAFDFVVGSHRVFAVQWGVSEGIAALLAAYLVGHVIAWPAAWLLERRLVRKVLGVPSQALFCEAPIGTLATVKQQLLPDYFTPLDLGTRERVTAKAHEEGHPANSGESLFWIAFARAKRDPVTYRRMETFLKLYAFCRNMAFVGLAAAALLITHMVWLVCHAAPGVEILDRVCWALIALIAGIVMLYRYLKFHRLYTIEIFTGYLELPPLKGPAADAS